MIIKIFNKTLDLNHSIKFIHSKYIKQPSACKYSMFHITHAKIHWHPYNKHLTLLLEDPCINSDSEICTCHTTPVVKSTQPYIHMNRFNQG